MLKNRPYRIHNAIFRARFVLPPHLSAIEVLPARPNEQRTRKAFGICRTRMPLCTCIDGSFFPEFTGTRAQGKEAFEPTGNIQVLSKLSAPSTSTISDITTLICQITRLIFDRSRVNSSHDLPTSKVIDFHRHSRWLYIQQQSSSSSSKAWTYTRRRPEFPG